MSLRDLLENQPYPHSYGHKFIGKHTPAFLLAAKDLETQFAHLNLTVEWRQSKKGDYIAYTFTFSAQNAEQILDLIQATSILQDLKMIL